MDMEHKITSAADSPPSNYQRESQYEKMITDRDVMVPMRDDVHLCVDIYRPDSSEQFPALLAFAIYNKDIQGPEMAEALPPQPAWSPLWTGPLEAGDTMFNVVNVYTRAAQFEGLTAESSYRLQRIGGNILGMLG